MKSKTKGLIIKIGASNPPTTAIAQLGDGTLNLGERDAALDMTTHDTTGNTHELLETGFKQPLSYDGEILYDEGDAVHEVIRAAHEAGTLLYFLAILPLSGAPQWLAQSRVKNVTIPLPVMGKLMINVSIEGMAATTFTA